MDRDGLLLDVIDSAERIDLGRKWQNTPRLESKGRVSYHRGLKTALSSFQTAQTQAASDLGQLMLAEKAYLVRELQLCDSTETETIASLEQAVRSFDDALRVLEIVSDSAKYVEVEKSYPTDKKYRYKEMPKDAFIVACVAHRTRIGNILRSPGISLSEKNLLKQRASNMVTAQSAYLDKQKAALNI